MPIYKLSSKWKSLDLYMYTYISHIDRYVWYKIISKEGSHHIRELLCRRSYDSIFFQF